MNQKTKGITKVPKKQAPASPQGSAINAELIKAAKAIITGFTSPRNLSSFIADALYWHTEMPVPADGKKKDNQFSLHRFIELVIPAWYEGGKDPAQTVSVALHEIYQAMGWEHFTDELMELVYACGYQGTYGRPSPDYALKALAGLTAMQSVGKHFHTMEGLEKLYPSQQTK